MAKGQRFSEAEKRAIAAEKGKLEDVATRHSIHFTTLSKWKRRFRSTPKTIKKKSAPKVNHVNKEILELTTEVRFWQKKYLDLVREKG